MRASKTCMAHCTAYYLRENIADIPEFVATPMRLWTRRWRRFWRKRSFKVTWVPYDESILTPKNKLFLVSGPHVKDGRASHHMVVYKGKAPLYDPDYRQLFLYEPRFIWILERL